MAGNEKTILLISILFFIYNAIKYLFTKGSELSLPTILYIMIIMLAIIIFIFHESELKNKQLKLDEFLKKG